ncbi:Cytochrome oxidase assembly protein ShyY1 [Jiangella alkaliphila]|uniref:SURF1-like protein n=1 Tax=Jiangella alkaliphila TaxID=419479 RepID=A0A1H2L1K2_9ACTN|nr:Cytochrome oxidase assembly protein ShyY1 [Jiangella alkaliphila]
MGVYRFLLTPRWLLLHGVAMAAVAGCLLLGWWQADVYQDSHGRHELRDREPVAVAELASPGAELGDGADRQVVATGTYLAGQQQIVPGRVHDGTLGSFVVTPLETDDGMVVPVLRGWVDDPEDAGAAVPAGEVTVTGYLLPPETSDHATVRTGQQLDDGRMAYIAPDQLAQRAGVSEATALHGYLLLRDESPAPAAAPVALDVDTVAPIRDVSPWQNLSYWAQWWVFALAAVVFWVSIVRNGVRTRRRADTPSTTSRGDDVSAPAPSHAPS